MPAQAVLQAWYSVSPGHACYWVHVYVNVCEFFVCVSVSLHVPSVYAP